VLRRFLRCVAVVDIDNWSSVAARMGILACANMEPDDSPGVVGFFFEAFRGLYPAAS
jgi:hypothetical protein